ncbi:MAG: YggS family pyridoxal phosphate-dependent enzyme [Bacteroidetes bacterium]|nr:YggS family pyridoxal phosphate-dependent enzyme [Bacteroidota bacterium]MCB8929767.1 YggS family pyridoxal phosphate-dependent enzyme [Bacteroidia bacterium]MCW5930819.1 YggS family pyridoxal phosphate-dependent enzyme [Bacteroidota bacterium]
MFDSMSYQKLIQELKPYQATLVAVSKKKPVTDIELALTEGQHIFGENYVQELCEKQPQLPQNIEWHFIGHLQSNKVKFIVPFVHAIQTIDSVRLLSEVDKMAGKHQRKVEVLLQVYIATEETKFGFDTNEILKLFDNGFPSLQNIRVAGLMGMASNTENTSQIRAEFKSLKNLFDKIKPGLDRTVKPVLSMGMTSDYKIALDEGSTMIRIGSALFGSR